MLRELRERKKPGIKRRYGPPLKKCTHHNQDISFPITFPTFAASGERSTKKRRLADAEPDLESQYSLFADLARQVLDSGAPLPGAVDTKPGSATLPFFGVQPALVDNEGRELEGVAEGNLVIKDSWPGQARSIWGNHQRFQETYFATFDHYYFTGDGARRDEDGYYWITGRVDDVLNVSGHRMGTAEIESALVAHATVCEAAVVGYPHEIKGQGIYCYVTLQDGVVDSTELLQELRQWVRAEIGPIASPDLIQFAPNLPKTRSGKIMRRILRKIAANDFSELGDTSTLSDPSVVNELIEKRCNK